jgi:hypothetical protein
MSIPLDLMAELLPVYLAAQFAQSRMDPQSREQIAKGISERRPPSLPRYAVDRADTEKLERLRAEGAVEFGNLIAKDKLAAIVAHFKNTPCYAAHVAAHGDGIARPLEETRKLSAYGSYNLADALKVPEICEILGNPRLLGIADQYLGYVPSIYSVHVFWTFKGQEGNTHKFHRDYDDFRFLTLFVYLTDIDENDGETQFIPGSHLSPQARQPYREKGSSLPFDASADFDPGAFFPPQHRDLGPEQLVKAEEIFARNKVSMGGKAGSAYLADTYGLHRGTPILKQDRLACWIRFGLTQNLIYHNDQTKPVSVSQLPHVQLGANEIPYPYRLIFSPD